MARARVALVMAAALACLGLAGFAKSDPSIISYSTPLSLSGQGATAQETTAVSSGQHLYWTVGGGGSIGEANLDGTGATTLIGQNGTSCPRGVVVDSSRVYWTDPCIVGSVGTIRAANLDGTGVTTLVSVNPISSQVCPEGVAVDGSHVYWADPCARTIMRANLDGTGVTTLVTDQHVPFFAGPYGLAVDSSHIYWAETGTSTNPPNGTIKEAGLDGGGVTTLATGQNLPQGVAVDSSHVYWADETGPTGSGSGGTIREANLDGTGVTTLTRTDSPQGLAVTPSQGASADLSLTMTASPDLVAVRGDLTYTITATNNGPSDATGVIVTDALDPSLSFVSATLSAGSSNAVPCPNAPPVTCSIGNLAAGNRATIKLVVQPTTKGWAPIANTASVAGNEPDPNPGNNTASTKACQYDPADVTPQAIGPLSLDNMNTSMVAHFTPQSGLTLKTALADCPNVAEFDWQQTITNLPSPSPFLVNNPARINSANLSPNNTLRASSTTPVSDPPPGGLVSQNAQDGTPNDPSPYYYYNNVAFDNEQMPATRCTVPLELDIYDGCIPLVSADGKTLSMFDHPSDDCLGGFGKPQLADPLCGGISDPPGSFIGYTTTLVAIMQDGTTRPIYSWKWTDTYSGIIGGVQLNAAMPLGSSASLGVDPNNGPGGVTITSLNGVPQTPPSVSCTASPSTLWPPDGKSVLVTVSGSVTPGTQAIHSGATTFAVTDEYGQVQPTGSITRGADGSYSFEVPLVAARDGNDQDGRTYSIVVTASDQIGNVGSCTATVTVPHDQGQ